MEILKIALIVLLPFYGAFISRWHGGGFIAGSPKAVKNTLWALPFALISFFAVFQEASLIVSIIAGATALGLCFVGKTLGHGGGIDMGHNPKEPGAGREPEKLEYLILWAHGKIPQYWYDAALLSICGLAAVSGAVLAFAFVNPLAAGIVVLGGLAKAPAYMIGWAMDPEDLAEFELSDFNEPTEIGEFLTGFFAYAGLAIAFAMTFSA